DVFAGSPAMPSRAPRPLTQTPPLGRLSDDAFRPDRPYRAGGHATTGTGRAHGGAAAARAAVAAGNTFAPRSVLGGEQGRGCRGTPQQPGRPRRAARPPPAE